MADRRHHHVRVIDSHTGGEPTRVVIEGGPDLGDGSIAQRQRIFAERHDDFRRAVVNEPRGSDVLVGALLLEPTDPSCCAAVIYFNNVGPLGMCGHGSIGLGATLVHMGRIQTGVHRVETSVGIVELEVLSANHVAIENVASYRHAKNVTLNVPNVGAVCGDIAWGGNWFFLVNDHGQSLELKNAEQLTQYAWAIRQSLERENITGADGATIDHIDLFGPAHDEANHSRNFMLCPGKAYDRSPCGTGLSAKIACLVADKKLAPGEIWRQESILGSVFAGSARIDASNQVIPRIEGSAFVTAESTLLLNPDDPFCMGIGL